MSSMRTETGFQRRLRGHPMGPRRGFLRDEQGVTAVEFGLLAIPFFSIIAAIMQTAIIFLASQFLETAVIDMARTIRTGQTQSGSSSIETLRTNICDRLLGLFSDCDGLHIRVVSMNQFQSAQVVVPIDTECEEDECEWNLAENFDTGGRDKVVLVQVFYKYPVVVQLGPFGLSNLGDGSRLIGSSAVFRNEPF